MPAYIRFSRIHPLFLAMYTIQGSGQAVADLGVGEGGLPDGARQFSNLVKVQKDWIALGKSIKDQGADVTPTEWKNVALFLRKVYQVQIAQQTCLFFVLFCYFSLFWQFA